MDRCTWLCDRGHARNRGPWSISSALAGTLLSTASRSPCRRRALAREASRGICSFDLPAKLAHEQIAQPFRLRPRGIARCRQLRGISSIKSSLCRGTGACWPRSAPRSAASYSRSPRSSTLGREHADRARGNHRTASAMLGALGKAILETLVVDALHLGGVSCSSPPCSTRSASA